MTQINPFSSGSAFFQPYSGYELYRIFDKSYYQGLGIEENTSTFSFPKLTGETVVTDGFPFLSANYYCISQGFDGSFSNGLGSIVDTGVNTVFYNYDNQTWESSLGGETYEYITCFSNSDMTYEEAHIELLYTQNVYIFHILFILIIFLSFYVFNLFTSRKT